MNADGKNESSAGPIVFITGAPGVGKSTVADALAQRFERAVRIDLDSFRQLVVRGLVQPSQGWSDETTLQFQIAHTAAGKVAQVYSAAGFAVIIEHCSGPDMLIHFIREAPFARVIGIRTDLEINLHRNATRTNKSFDPNDIAHFVHSLNSTLPAQLEAAGFGVIDSTALTVDETAEEVLKHV